jgi:hypothetical protein
MLAAVFGDVSDHPFEIFFQRLEPLALGDPFFVAGVELLRARILAKVFHGQRAVGLEQAVELVTKHSF